MTTLGNNEPVTNPVDEITLDAAVKVGNLGKPIILRDVAISGVTAEAAALGAPVKLWTRATFTSDQSVFHRVAPNLLSVLKFHIQQANQHAILDRASTILLVIKPNDLGELWIDAAAIALEARVKRDLPALTVVMQSDITDVTGMWFPSVDISAEDKIIVIFREGFRFGLFFDFNHENQLNIENAKRDLGTLYRQLRYADVYATVANENTSKKLFSEGWFPFIEILGGTEFTLLSDACQAGISLAAAESELLKNFSHERLDRTFDRWVTKPHLKDKEAILLSAIRAFKASDWVACIKIVLTEIEGVIAEAYFDATGNKTSKMYKLLSFIEKSAIKQSGGRNTLFFPIEFVEYLRQFTYAHSNLQSTSRHAVGHGQAKAEDYSAVRALQAILTLDQIAFYT